MFTRWWGTGLMETFNSNFPNLEKAGQVALISWMVWVVVSIVLHELAHGWAAIRSGDSTPRDLGHMTLDPMKHMGIVSLVCLALVGITWGAMPVSPDNFRRRHDDAFVAIAGPATNVLLAIACFALLVVTQVTLTGDAADYARIVFFLGFALNIFLALLNMIPLPPLDGSRVVASFITPYKQFVYNPATAIIGLILIFTIGSSMIAPVLGAIIQFSNDALQTILGAMGRA